MANLDFGDVIDVYTTAPQSKESSSDEYVQQVIEVASWSDGCAGMLIYSDNSIVDPWLVAQTVLTSTKSLRPLVAVQPLYMHPYAAAKMVTSLAFMYKRAVALNMIAGGFTNDYPALGDTTAHDDRYERLLDYTLIMQYLLQGAPFSFEHSKYYTVENVKLTPPLPRELYPKFLISGSSPAGRKAALAANAVGVEYPKPPGDSFETNLPKDFVRGIRVGVISRDTDREARDIAAWRFPPSRRGQLTRQIATQVSDSHWHQQLASTRNVGAYSLEPWQYGYSNCPYLIGDHSRVAEALSEYLRIGFKTFILDIPRQEEDLIGADIAFHKALQIVSGTRSRENDASASG